MKKLLFVFALSILLSPFAPRAQSQDISVDFFYNNLNGGSWIEVGNYGYCWQPDVAVNDSTWRPYADGYWAYTDDGWTWISYEDFGWCTYHYGRWVKLADYGWVWKPGYEWAPAWVSWRTGGNYIGWAPLPPETEYVYESRPLTGHLDVEFDIGPAYYNFVDVRYIGEPVLRSRIVPFEQNITYVNQTVNVTNITYKNKIVYNYGPDVNVVNQYSSRPIQRLKLERQTSADVSVAAKSGGLTKVQGNALVVAAPQTIQKPAQEMAPPTVKTKVAQPRVEKGWSVAGDPNAQAQLKEKIKAQDLKKVPPPTLGGNPAAAAGAAASVAPTTSLAPGMAPVEKGKKKGKAAEQFQAGATASPAGGAVGAPTAGPGVPEKGKHRGKFGEQNPSGAMTSPGQGTGTEMSPAMPESGKPGKGGGKGHRGEQFSPPPSGPTSAPEGMNAPETKPKGKAYERNLATPSGGTSPSENLTEPRGGKHKQFEQPPSGMSPSGQSPAGPQGGPYGEGRGKHKQLEQPPTGQQGAASAPPAGPSGEGRAKHQEGVNAPPTGAPQAPAGQAGEGKHEGKKKGGESPAPTPQ